MALLRCLICGNVVRSECARPDPQPRATVRDRMPRAEESETGVGREDGDTLRMALAEEEWASAFYAEAARVAGEARVAKVFLALSEVECDHFVVEQHLLAQQSGA